jgi:hypothetical protein
VGGSGLANLLLLHEDGRVQLRMEISLMELEEGELRSWSISGRGSERSTEGWRHGDLNSMSRFLMVTTETRKMLAISERSFMIS